MAAHNESVSNPIPAAPLDDLRRANPIALSRKFHNRVELLATILLSTPRAFTLRFVVSKRLGHGVVPWPVPALKKAPDAGNTVSPYALPSLSSMGQIAMA